jgi:cysteine desulfurase
MQKERIYLDNAATTRLDPRVMEVMRPWFTEYYGNASSLHQFGTEARDALENARSDIAALIHAKAEEIYFTSGGTESNNLALKGIAFGSRRKTSRIIVSAIEHDCILNTCKYLEELGFEIVYLPVDEYGLVDPETVRNAINASTLLVSVMHANNEIGTIEPIAEIGRICREKSVPFHTDACQTFGKIPLNVEEMNIDIMSLNAHKIHGPKGVGALYLRQGLHVEPQLFGGGQEKGIRSSTENIPGIIGFVEAAKLCTNELSSEMERLRALQHRTMKVLESVNSNIYINGHREFRLPNNIHIGIEGLEGETIRLLLLLDEEGIAISTGSACSSNAGASGASHVLQATGLNPFQARGGIRISLGRFTTEDEIEQFLGIFARSLKKLNPII